MKRSAVFTKAETRIEKLSEIRRNRIEGISAQIEKTSTLIEKAEEEAAAIVEAGQLAEDFDQAQQKNEEFAAKQREISAARAYKESCSRFLDNLQNKPAISSEEYEELTAALLEEMENQNQKAKEQIVELCGKILEIGKENEEFISRGNGLLERLQHDLYLDKDRKRMRDGSLNIWDGSKKVYKDTSVKEFADNIEQRFVFIGGVKPEPENKNKLFFG